MATTNSWSAGTISKLKVLLERGMSTAEIGKRLGFTKNAVVGKINRLKLNVGKNAKSSAQKPKPAAKKAPVKKPAPVKKAVKAPVKKAPAKPVKKAPSKPVKKVDAKTVKEKEKKAAKDTKLKTERIIQHSAALMALRADQCRWPLGDPDSGDFRFCGEKCFVGKPYCFEHCKVAYQFTQPAKKR